MLTSGTKKVYMVGNILDVSATYMGINNPETGSNTGINRNGNRISSAVFTILCLAGTPSIQAADVGTGSSSILVRSSVMSAVKTTPQEISSDLVTLNINQRINGVFQMPNSLPPREGMGRWMHEWKTSRKIMFGTVPGTNIQFGAKVNFSNPSGKI